MGRDRLLAAAASLLGDPIVAAGTPPGRGAIGKVRLSGEAGQIDRILARVLPAGVPARLAERRAVLADLLGPRGEPIDRGIVLRFRGPRSYTGEDVVEFDLHGSPVVLEQAIDALCEAGARPARPGEFTQRAVRNGKMDLLEAEATDALVRAESASAARLARRHLGGELASVLAAWRARLLGLAATLEAVLDFPDETDSLAEAEAYVALRSLREEIEALAASLPRGRRLLDGTRAVLTGPVNAGKSTVFNLLLGHGRAIVSPWPGTTRDVVSETLLLEGRAFRLEDTAGRRGGEDPVEALGIARSIEAERHADVRIAVRDGREVAGEEPAPGGIGVATRRDLLGPEGVAALARAGWIVVDGTNGDGLADLRTALLWAAEGGEGDPGGLAIHTARQERALRESAGALREAEEAGPEEPAIAALAVGRAGRAIEDLAGRWTEGDVIEEVFRRFCVGK